MSGHLGHEGVVSWPTPWRSVVEVGPEKSDAVPPIETTPSHKIFHGSHLRLNLMPFERGRLHQLKGDLDSAVLDYTQAISLKGDDASAYFRRAELWSKKGDHANVIIDLTECLRLQPNYIDAYVARGYSRLDFDLDAARQDFVAAQKLNPRHVGALIGQAEVWTRQGDHEKAIEALTAVLEVAPEIADIYERRGRVRMEQGERDLAIDDFTAALRINPKHTGCLFLRSSAWSQQGNLQRALDDCRAILAIEPKNLMAYYEMANAHSSAGQKDEALEDFAAVSVGA